MIRPAVLADLPAVAAVERSAAQLFAGTHMDWATRAPTLARWRLRRATARGLLLVAEECDTVAGFVAAAPAWGTLYIEEFSVALPRQRRGLGRALLAALEHRAWALGIPALTLTTDRALPWNAPLYARMGFVAVSEPAWLMARLATQPDSARRCAMRKAIPFS